MPESELSPRMEQVLDAALTVVADNGIRGLTHRAVDRAAGLPEGSTSAYLRTRSALQIAVARYVADRLAADVALMSQTLECAPADNTLAIQETSRLFLRWLKEPRLLIAKLELTMEGLRDPNVGEILAESRDQLVDVVVAVLQAADEPHDRPRAATLVAALDGIIGSALQQPPRSRRAYVEQSVGILLPSITAEVEPA